MRYDLPTLALSIRQPWAWAIIYAGKDIENRSWQAANHGLRRRGRIAVHAAKNMSQAEYADAAAFMKQMIGIQCPAAVELRRGGIIGSVEVIDVVSKSDSAWFFGPRGLVLRDAKPCPFISVVGMLGYFKWIEGGEIPESAKWMLPKRTVLSFPGDPDLELFPAETSR